MCQRPTHKEGQRGSFRRGAAPLYKMRDKCWLNAHKPETFARVHGARRKRNLAGINPMPSLTLCSEVEVAELVTNFYAKVRSDAILGPIFERHVADWSLHIPKLIAFWSTALCGSKSYRGNPLLMHRVLPGLSSSAFERWLDLFHETTRALPNRAMAERADHLSKRMAQNFWYDYQMQREPGQMPVSLANRAATPDEHR